MGGAAEVERGNKERGCGNLRHQHEEADASDLAVPGQEPGEISDLGGAGLEIRGAHEGIQEARGGGAEELQTQPEKLVIRCYLDMWRLSMLLALLMFSLLV